MTPTRGADLAVLALAFALVSAPAMAAEGGAAEIAPETCSLPVPTAPTTPGPDVAASPVPSVAATPIVEGGKPDLTRGRWARMARAPFGSEYEPVAWTGRRMVAVDGDTGRTAIYAPSRDRWRKAGRAPLRFDSTARSVWTGDELVILAMSPDGRSVDAAAYRPEEESWRLTARLEADPDGETDHALADALWTGTHVVVVDSLGLLAAYDPAADCWVDLGRVPGEPWAWRLYANGPALLVESRRPDEPVEIRAFDPATTTWSEPAVGPLDRDASEAGGAWVDGQLVYVTWLPLDDEAGASNATFDPATMTWSTFEHDCATPATGTLAVEGLLVASDGRRALDGETLACLDLPAPPRRLNGTERLVWTGSELIAWSGIRSLPAGPRRDGLVFRPAGNPEDLPTT